MARESLEKELQHMFREDIIAACQYWGVDLSSAPSGEDLTQLLAERMRDPEMRARVFATFTDRETDLLGMLTLNGGAMSYDKLKPFRKIYSHGQLNQTVRDLRKKGIVVRRMMSRVTEFGRETAEFKVIDFFMPHLIAHFSAKPTPRPDPPRRVKKFVDYRDTLLLDMLILVSYVAKNEVKMTSSWEFPRREADRIREHMSTPTEERFETVQRLARKAGVYTIVEDDRVIPSKVEQLFAGRQEHVTRRLLLSTLGRTRAIWATPDQPTEYTMNLVVCRLRESSTDQWISIEEMKAWVRSELFIEREPLKWIQVDEERVRMALEVPVLLGLVEAAYKGKKLVAVRLTDLGDRVINQRDGNGPSGDTFIVLPNFEITVFSTEMDYASLYRLMLFTEPVRIDVVSTFRITDSSVFEATKLGLRDRDIVEFLERESSKPVPKNVLRSIRDWATQTTFATVSEVTLFETESERDLEDLMFLDEFKQFVVRQVGPRAVVVSADLSTLTEALHPHKVNVSGPQMDITGVLQTTAPSTEPLLVQNDHHDPNVPEACVGCPALQSCNRVLRRKARGTRGPRSQ